MWFIVLLLCQALPLVTVMVGKATMSGLCRVTTMAEHVDEPRSVEFQLPKSEAELQPGQPLWANYIKGVIAFFPHKGSSYCLLLLGCLLCFDFCGECHSIGNFRNSALEKNSDMFMIYSSDFVIKLLPFKQFCAIFCKFT